MKRLWFQLHWLFGITAGIVLAIVGTTGAVLTFEDDLIRALNPGVMTIVPQADQPLSPPELIRRIRTQSPNRRIVNLTVSSNPTDAARVGFAVSRTPSSSDEQQSRARIESVYINPYTGQLLGPPRGEAFFRFVTQLHRRLVAEAPGKHIVGASTVALIMLCLSGLYLRWPRKAQNWRSWLTLDFKHTGRSFLWHLHAVSGTWVLLCYLLAGLTGLYFSYDWYRNGLLTLTGTPRPTRDAIKLTDVVRGHPSLDLAWAVFLQQSGGFRQANITLPERPQQALDIRYLTLDAPHDRARSRIALHPSDGSVLLHERYADKPAGSKLIASMFALHSGSFFGLPGTILMMLASLSMPLFTITGWQMYLDRRKNKHALQRTKQQHASLSSKKNATPSPIPLTQNRDAQLDAELLITFASQSGQAERIAWQTAGALQANGVPVLVQNLGGLDIERLDRFQRILFIVSTFGDGQAPDNARRFVRRIMSQTPSLTRLRYALLALGDRQYQTFCAFGRSLDTWLRAHGAQSLFERVEVDRHNEASLQRWHDKLGTLNPQRFTTPQTVTEHWRLHRRHLLNPGSQGNPTYHIELVPSDKPFWQAGDIAEIIPHSDPSPTDPHQHVPREYSIASLPSDRHLHLLVRQTIHENGTLGLSSGWLTETAALGCEIECRIRTNPHFHGPRDNRPMILIGNGTGLAGLRAHLKARAKAGHSRNWLIFGERNAATDFYYRQEIDQWISQGIIVRLDLAFSRDQAERIYVQHRLRQAADILRTWLAEGAALYICGSLEGMAPAVEQTIIDIIGTESFERLIETGCYRRDVY